MHHRLRSGFADALHMCTAVPQDGNRLIGVLAESDGQVIMAQVESGATWSKPNHAPLARLHWSNAAIAAGRREASMSKRIFCVALRRGCPDRGASLRTDPPPINAKSLDHGHHKDTVAYPSLV